MLSLLPRLFPFLALAAALSTPTATPPPTKRSTAQFTTPTPALPLPPRALHHLLLRRDDSCPASHTGCSEYGRDSVCCPTTASCTTDEGEPKHIACCASGATCTGTLGEGNNSGGGGTASGGGGGGGGGSTVSNTYYPWTYVPSSFSNRGQCSSYLSSCMDEYNNCASSLVNGGSGVTISGPGVTMGGGGNSGLGQASAAEVCRSLSSEACSGINQSSCASLPSGTAAEATATDDGGDGAEATVVAPANGGLRVEGAGWRWGLAVGVIGGMVV